MGPFHSKVQVLGSLVIKIQKEARVCEICHEAALGPLQEYSVSTPGCFWKLDRASGDKDPCWPASSMQPSDRSVSPPESRLVSTKVGLWAVTTVS